MIHGIDPLSKRAELPNAFIIMFRWLMQKKSLVMVIIDAADTVSSAAYRVGAPVARSTVILQCAQPASLPGGAVHSSHRKATGTESWVS